jgi:hypothetical protein
MKQYELFIDESGVADPLDKKSRYYVLCGCAVEKEQRMNLKIRADQIKFKYWGNTNVLFHSRDIGMKIGDYALFKKQKTLYVSFLKDLFDFLHSYPYTIFVTFSDKQEVRAKGWNVVKLIRETAHRLFYHFIVWLLASGGHGKITVESATSEHDRYYLMEFSYFLSPGCREFAPTNNKIKPLLTSIAFVTKQNSDIEEEIADLFAYAAQCKYLRQSGKETFKIGSYEDRMIRVLDRKLFQKPKFAKETKMKLYEAIEPFCIVPKT